MRDPSLHVSVGFDNPFLVCKECKESTRYWHDPKRCQCDGEIYTVPCKHKAGVTSLCPTWNPIQECTCTEAHKS